MNEEEIQNDVELTSSLSADVNKAAMGGSVGESKQGSKRPIYTMKKGKRIRVDNSKELIDPPDIAHMFGPASFY